MLKQLDQVKREKDVLSRKISEEEENNKNNLKKRLEGLLQEKAALERQLEHEQAFIRTRLTKQLQEATAKKDALRKKMEEEKKAKAELSHKIEEEQKQLKLMLQEKLEQVRKEKSEIEFQKEQEMELVINHLAVVLGRLVNEKKELEDMLAKEVQEKQELISALSKEKHSLTKRLKLILKEIKHDKAKIKQKVQKQAVEGLLGEQSPKGEEEKLLTKASAIPFPGDSSRNLHMASSASEEAVKGKNKSQHMTPKMTCMKEPENAVEKKNEELEIGQVFDQHEQRVAILEKDKKIYDKQYKRLSQKVGSLKTQLTESLQEASKCNANVQGVDRKILEDITSNRMSKAEVDELMARLEQRSFMTNMSIESQYVS
eukprot:TRINITY_DN7219_c0_g1_i2.p2 TRINITY_DN7219_c0_g1~~TRINITY_DN7219_c0_g1_i2.p2  ORF type:complete len:372 (-),score=164.66 TRINITY_DN7219_c0_g1_i2:327-1442(-)